MRHWTFITIFALVLSCLTFMGCKKDGLYEITGTVTFDGTPVQQGQIDFAPVSGSDGISAGGKIVDGKYAVRLLPGNMAVSISSSQKIKKENPTQEEIERGIDTVVQEIIPEKYNRRSQLKQEVTEGQKVYDFDLTSE